MSIRFPLLICANQRNLRPYRRLKLKCVTPIILEFAMSFTLHTIDPEADAFKSRASLNPS